MPDKNQSSFPTPLPCFGFLKGLIDVELEPSSALAKAIAAQVPECHVVMSLTLVPFKPMAVTPQTIFGIGVGVDKQPVALISQGEVIDLENGTAEAFKQMVCARIDQFFNHQGFPSNFGWNLSMRKLGNQP